MSLGPTIGPAPIGEVVLPVGTWKLFDEDHVKKVWEPPPLTKVTLYGAGSLEIPSLTDKKLKAELGLFAAVRARAHFFAGYGPGELRDLKVGMSRTQALLLGAALAAGRLDVATLIAYLGKFTATARLFVPSRITLGFGITGELQAGAALGVEIVNLEAGVEADAKAEIEPTIQRDISLYWDSGRLHLERKYEINDPLNLEFQLNAFIKAQLLETFSWEKHWELTKTLIDQWPIRAILELHGDPDETSQDGAPSAANIAILKPGKGVKFTLEEGKVDAETIFKKTFERAKGKGEKVDRGDGSRAKRSGGHRAPVGTHDDPILMVWVKPLRRYKNPIYLVTPRRHVEPFYRDKKAPLGPKRVQIGVDHWPAKGEIIQKKPGTPRGGKAERDFKQLLEDEGFEEWDSYSPDHVVDLAFGGTDDFSNLWPLERGTNERAGTWQTGQGVEYNDEADPPDAPPKKHALGSTNLDSRYFKIRQVADPP